MTALVNSPLVASAAKALGVSADDLQYGNPSLDYQLTHYGVRSLELDVFADPSPGGRFALRAGPKMAAVLRIPGANASEAVGPPDLNTTGWKVLHLPDLDYGSNCDTLAEGLALVRGWLEGRRAAAQRAGIVPSPLFILFETPDWNTEGALPPLYANFINNALRTSNISGSTALATSVPVTPDVLADLEASIVAALGREWIYPPDQFRAGYETLRDRIIAKGHPSLDEINGRVLLMLEGRSAAAVATYRQMYSTRAGRANGTLYLNLHIDKAQLEAVLGSGSGGSATGDAVGGGDAAASGGSNSTIGGGGSSSALLTLLPDPDAVFVTLLASTRSNRTEWDEQARSDARLSTAVVRNGYILRAMADLGAMAAMNYTYRRDAIVASGAHLLHTDYAGGHLSECGPPSNYTLALAQQQQPGPQAGALLCMACNPITAPATCPRAVVAAAPPMDAPPGPRKTACGCEELA